MQRNPIIFLLCIVLLILGLWFWYENREASAPEPVLPQGQDTGAIPPFPELTTNYITAMEWPPAVETREGTLSCSEERTINGNIYCVTTTSEGAAGSVYTTYTYETQRGNMIASTTFTLRMVQCLNYDEPERTECEQERASFNADLLADQLLTTGGV